MFPYEKPISRRRALSLLGTTAAGVCLMPRYLTASPDVMPRNEMLDLAQRLRDGRAPDAMNVAANAVRQGATPELLLGAAFLAGVHDVRPRHVGGKLHCVMMTESAFQLAALGSRFEAYLAAFRNIHEFKRSQRRDRNEGDWQLPPRPEVHYGNEASARRDFTSAMDRWDDEWADRAIVGLLAFHDHDSLFEVLWPYACRCYVNIGHKIIYAVQAERVLRRLGWSQAEPVLRSLVHALLHDAQGNRTASFELARENLHAVPAWRRADTFPAAARRVRSRNWHTTLRQADGADAAMVQQTLLTALPEEPPEVVWDGLRLYAAELFLRRGGAWAGMPGALLPVHAVTVMQAFAYVWRTSRRPETRRLALLQAVSWLPAMRDDLLVRGRISLEGDAVAEMKNGGHAVALDDLLASPSAANAYASLQEGRVPVEACMTRLARNLLRHTIENHQYKYAGALLDELQYVEPEFVPEWLSPALPYLPPAADPDNDVFQQSREALASAGVFDEPQ